MGVELEVKFKADEAALQAIDAAFTEPGQCLQMETVYYDTAAGELSALHYTLRLRKENDKRICTLKTPAGQGRNEWETECGHIEDAISVLCKLGGPETLQSLTENGVIPICGARFTRIAKTVTLPDAVIELALDRGVLTGGGKELPFYEAEAELKCGKPEALYAFARTLAAQFSLQPEPKSKFRRALELTKGE